MLLYSKATGSFADIQYKIKDDKLILGEDEWYLYTIKKHIDAGAIQIFRTNYGDFVFLNETDWADTYVLLSSFNLPRTIQMRANKTSIIYKTDNKEKTIGKVFSVKNIRKNVFSVKFTNGHILNFRINTKQE